MRRKNSPRPRRPSHAHPAQVGKFGIITGFDDETKEAEFERASKEITLRILVTHTSGYTYDWFYPTLLRWRASRNEIHWAGERVEQKATIPLIFAPGTAFAYGVGMDWTGKAVECVTNSTLEEYMRQYIWDPLDMTDITFHPLQREDMQGRIADLSSLGPEGKGPAVLESEMDILGGATEPFGGGGAFASTEAFFTFLHAVPQRNPLLLSPASFEELFRPQLSPAHKASLNESLYSDPLKAQYLVMELDQGIRKTWCLADLLCEDGQEGRSDPGLCFGAGCRV
jgi:CubicO group peptidase (beta-lactamase class C family)